MPLHKDNSPSFIGLFVSALFFALCGASIGFVYLLSFPPLVFTSLANAEAAMAERTPGVGDRIWPEPGDTFFIEGPLLQSQSWLSKRAQLQEGTIQSVRLSPGELNSWLRARLRPEPAGGEGGKSTLTIAPGVPNFALLYGSADERLHFSLPVEVAYGSKRFKLTVFGRCNVVQTGLELDELFLGCAQIPLPSILGQRALATLTGSFAGTEDFALMQSTLERVVALSVDEGALLAEFR
jgi:hypothetical protein